MKTSLTAIAALFLSLVSASAQYTLTYVTNGSVVTLETYSGTPVNVCLPDFVTEIGTVAFDDCASLTTITIPTNVNTIDEAAFFECTSLASIIIPGSVTNLGEGIFSYCTSLTNAVFGPGATNTGQYTFEECFALNHVTLPNSLISIDDYAFAQCFALTNVVIPGSAVNIGNVSFYECIGLTFLSIPSSVTSLGEDAFYGCSNLTGLLFYGEPPAGDTNVFSYDPATAYYLPGQSGWSSPFCGIPAVLWNPSIQITNAGFASHGNKFGFSVNGTPNIPIVITAFTNLSSLAWTAELSCTLTNGSISFIDSTSGNVPARFYQVAFP